MGGERMLADFELKYEDDIPEESENVDPLPETGDRIFKIDCSIIPIWSKYYLEKQNLFKPCVALDGSKEKSLLATRVPRIVSVSLSRNSAIASE
jgi:hypothetical protein